MKKQQIVALRQKSIADLMIEQGRLLTDITKSDNVHTQRRNRQDRAQILTIIREKQLLELTKNHEE